MLVARASVRLCVPCLSVNTRFASSSQTAIEQLHTYTFYKRLAASDDRAALILFSSPVCGSCHAFRRVLPAFQETANKTGRINIDVFEVDAGGSMGLTNEHEVFDLPALFLYNGGEFHSGIQAPPVVDSLLSAVETALSQPAEEPP
jgi:thiol-disulfide isomerase/thioredoxin